MAFKLDPETGLGGGYLGGILPEPGERTVYPSTPLPTPTVPTTTTAPGGDVKDSNAVDYPTGSYGSLFSIFGKPVTGSTTAGGKLNGNVLGSGLDLGSLVLVGAAVWLLFSLSKKRS